MVELQLVMYIIQIVMLKLVGVMDKSCDVQFMSCYVHQKVVTGRFHAVLFRSQVVIPILQFVIESVFYT